MLLKVSKFFLYVSLFSVVVVMTSTFFPFIGGKDYFFRFSVELALIFYILWWAFEAADGEAWSQLKDALGKPLFIAVSVFVLVFLLACIFAYDSHGAFWSNFERGEGGFQMLHYYTFFVLLVLLFRTKNNWNTFFKVFLIAASLMVLYGIFANLGWADNFISPYQGGGVPSTAWGRLVATRFEGSLGNPAYVAPYLMFSLFYLFYLWVCNKSQRRWLAVLGYAALAFFLFFFFILTQTKGAFFGLCAAVLVFLIYLIAKSPPRIRRISVIILVCLTVAAAPLFYFANSPVIQKLPASRLLDLSVLTTHSFDTRLWTWGSAWQGFLERPILGWGPENFSAVFDKYFNPKHFVIGEVSETWFDRAHSVFFDYLSETGILGLLSYLGIFAVFYWEFIRKGEALKKRYGTTIMALMISLPIGYLVQGIVIFDVLPIYINLFLFLAFGYFWFYDLNEQHA